MRGGECKCGAVDRVKFSCCVVLKISSHLLTTTHLCQQTKAPQPKVKLLKPLPRGLRVHCKSILPSTPLLVPSACQHCMQNMLAAVAACIIFFFLSFSSFSSLLVFYFFSYSK